MSELPKPPRIYEEFIARYPDLGDAWESLGKAGAVGPLSDREVRLIKLALAMGAMREGAVHSNVRKALAFGVEREDLEQVVALAASTMGMPSTVALYSWLRDVLDA